MTNNNSYYHDLNGAYVIVNTRSSSFVGMLEADTHETLRLRPSIVHEPNFKFKDGNMQTVPHYRLEQKLPTVVNTMDVSSVQPTTETHVHEIVNYDAKTYEPRIKQGEDKR
jgi:hypothetical protein